MQGPFLDGLFPPDTDPRYNQGFITTSNGYSSE